MTFTRLSFLISLIVACYPKLKGGLSNLLFARKLIGSFLQFLFSLYRCQLAFGHKWSDGGACENLYQNKKGVSGLSYERTYEKYLI